MKSIIYHLSGFFTFVLLVTFSLSAYAQQTISGTFTSGGQTRSYLGAEPSNPQGPLRLVILFCGANENASQMVLRGFNNYIGSNSMVVYPEPSAIMGFDNVQGVDDFQMVEDLIADIDSNYSIDTSDICIGGFSNGGIFTYSLACDFNSVGSNRAYRFRAMAVVSGTMENNTTNLTDCPVAGSLPLIVFHGTQDPIMNVNGGFLIPPISMTYSRLDSVVSFWATTVNGCAASPTITSLPDTVNEVPNSSVQLHDYSCSSTPNTQFYSVQGGFHSWPRGNASIDSAQAANQDVDASQLIANFFNSSTTLSTEERNFNQVDVVVYPNPVKDMLSIKSDQEVRSIEIINTAGASVLTAANSTRSIAVDRLVQGVYFLKVDTDAGTHFQKIIKK